MPTLTPNACIAGGLAAAVAVNTILEYDTTGDFYTEIGTMTQDRYYHAISVVQYGEFSNWCQ